MEKKYTAKKIINMVILGLAITLFITILIVFLTSDIEAIGKVMANIDLKYLGITLALLLGYAILYPIPLCLLTRKKKCNISMRNTYLIGSTEHFFNGITPFATGGQPFQAYAYNRLGVPLADSTGILVLNFVLYMCATNLFALISLFYYPVLSQGVSNLLAMVIIGFTINFFVLVFLIVVATSKKFCKLLERALLFLCKSKRLGKLLRPAIPAFNAYCENAQAAFRELRKCVGTSLLCFVIKLVTLALYYAITFYILKAFGIAVTYDKMFFIMCSTAFAITMCVFIPTPGGSGGIEFAFMSIFTVVAAGITPYIAMSGMLIWRILSYYLLMLLSFVTYLVLERITTKYEKRMASAYIEPPAYADDSISSEGDDKIDTAVIADSNNDIGEKDND